MRRDLFIIPHQPFDWEIPIFGFGWALALWILISAIWLICQVYRRGWNSEIIGFLPLFVMVAVAVRYLLPNLEIVDATGTTVGLPIRGYGLMLLLGVVSGLLLAAWRAQQSKIDPEHIYSLGFAMIVSGILGARLFYVVQFWDDFATVVQNGQRVPVGLVPLLKNLMNIAEGGLVVYGSAIGAFLAAWWYLRRHQLPKLLIADVIAPSLFLGLSLGRIGCLLNGCCYGDFCDLSWGLSFPPGSPAFQQQQQDGSLASARLGATFALDSQNHVQIQHVVSGSAAARAGTMAGDRVLRINGRPADSLSAARSLSVSGNREIEIETDKKVIRWALPAIQETSLPVHPTQVYSAINAALLCLFLIALSPFGLPEGAVFATGMTIYPISRFILEMVRAELPIMLGLTISQLTSLGLILFATGVWYRISHRG